MRSRRVDVKRAVALGFTAALLAVGVHAQQTPRLVQGKVYVLSPADGNGSNVVVQSGPDGVMLVDTQPADAAQRVFAAVRSLSPEPIRWIVNTSARVDHMGGNDALTRLGTTPGSAGGSVQGEIDALNTILHIAVPGKYQEGGTYIVPGHGRICDEADVVEYRDMVTVVRDRIQDLIKKGSSLEQVKAAKPSRDYDPEYTRSGGPAAETFVDVVYRSLTKR